MSENVCISGACEGADLEWGDAAALAGHKVLHYGFVGMNQNKKKVPYFVLGLMELREADAHLQKANTSLQRGTFPYRSDYVNNLLRRNYWQVKAAERVYAVAPISQDGMTVRGGTGWAVQMAIDTHVPKIYVFNTVSNYWYEWNNGFCSFGEFGKPPKPHGIYAAIGSREITDDGRKAIHDVYRP